MKQDGGCLAHAVTRQRQRGLRTEEEDGVEKKHGGTQVHQNLAGFFTIQTSKNKIVMAVNNDHLYICLIKG